MKAFLHINIAFLLVQLLLMSNTHREELTAPVCYQILEDSKLFLEGATNVNSFICDCTGIDAFPPFSLEMEVEEASQQISFNKASLNIKTKHLDCGHRVMNNDLYKCLKAEKHPFISVALEKANLSSYALNLEENQWAFIISRAKLTVAGTTKEVFLKVSARKQGKQTYRFVSKHIIQMTDYGITPPTTMLGLVKVEDQVTIHFDLLVKIE